MTNGLAHLTPSARRVLVMASTAAARLHHGQIDSIHLLIGLLDDEQDGAAQALTDLRLTRPLVTTAARQAIGQTATTQELTPATRAALRAAVASAKGHRHPRITALHLLVGLLVQPSPAVAHALHTATLSPTAVRAAVTFVMG